MATPKAGHYEEADWTDPEVQAAFGMKRVGRNIVSQSESHIIFHTLDDQELAQCEAREKEKS